MDESGISPEKLSEKDEDGGSKDPMESPLREGSLEEQEGRRSRRTAAINQRLLMKRIASDDPIMDQTLEAAEEDENVKRKKELKKQPSITDYNIKWFNTMCGGQFTQKGDLMWSKKSIVKPMQYVPRTQTIFEAFKVDCKKGNENEGFTMSMPKQEPQIKREVMEGEVYNCNEREPLRIKKKKKILVDKEHIVNRGLNYIETYLNTNPSLFESDIQEIRNMGMSNIEVESGYLENLGGKYEELKDDAESINKIIQSLQTELNQLYTKMGKTQLSKISEPPVLVFSTTYSGPKDKDKGLEYEEILEEMKDFQDLVNDEHREKRRLFKNLILGTSRQISKMEMESQKSKSEKNKQVLQLHKNISNLINLFWKKIEKFAWEHLKKDLNQELMKKKKQNLDKFIQDAIKLSVNDQDRYILQQKIKGTTTNNTLNFNKSNKEEVKGNQSIEKGENKNHKVEDPDSVTRDGVSANEDDLDQVEEEYVLDREEERMEQDDLELEADMDSDKEEGELDGLQKDLEMPIEELLKMYQSNRDLSDESEYDEESDEIDQSEDLNPEDRKGNSAVKNKEPPKRDTTRVDKSPKKSDRKRNVDIPRPHKQHSKKEDNDEVGYTDSVTKDGVSANEDDLDQVEEEYVLDREEERMEQDDLELEADMDSDKEEGELDGLQKDLEMPIEELLKMYQSNRDLSDESEYDEESDEIGQIEDLKRDSNKAQDTLNGDLNGRKPRNDKRSQTDREKKKENKEVEGKVIIGKVETPFLIRGVLRPYQSEGLAWLVSLYKRGINGVLADEMGLGKTLQAISLLAYLACEEGNWGPHIIIVPTSILLNWVMEFNKFCPGFKILAYYGNQQERAKKRTGWNRPHSFNVLISSYSTVVMDSSMLKRKVWEYMILDEAQNIKNFNSKRWQTLLTFNTKHRLLLTGTPLQNSLQELWSLMHFILPNIFTSHTQFNIWFTDPLNQALDNMYSTNPLYRDKDSSENKEREEINRSNMELVEKLHVIFRPYLLRRLKKDVEKQMPSKYEHVLKCTLTKRQQVLYDEYISLYNLNNIKNMNKEGVKEGLSYRSMLNILMQLRKICNHPNQLKAREIQIPVEFNIETMQEPYMLKLNCNKNKMGNLLTNNNINRNKRKNENDEKEEVCGKVTSGIKDRLVLEKGVKKRKLVTNAKTQYLLQFSEPSYGENNVKELESDLERCLKDLQSYQSSLKQPSNGVKEDEVELDSIKKEILEMERIKKKIETEEMLKREDSILNLKIKNKIQMNQIVEEYISLLTNFLIMTDKVVSRPVRLYFSGKSGINYNNRQDWHIKEVKTKLFKRNEKEYYKNNKVTVEAINTNYRMLFPSKRSLNDDCGKFKVLGPLLLRLKSEGHRCIVYTQFSKMLDILENWINFMGFTYTRLDGSTKVEMRQKIINRFNENTKIFLFISSTRSGGVGITLTGADTVIFYDTDWNPAIDRQAMDRCHRIGQTKDVNVYRLISEHTVEENIWRKQLQKRKLDDLIVDQGQFDVQHNNWFANIDTLINILQDKRDEGDEDDIYGKKILHESAVDQSTQRTPGVQSLKMLIEVEDADDSIALQKLTKENEKINKQDFENDIINSIPSLVSYCIKFLLKYQTVSLIKNVETMKLKIQIEEYQNQKEEEEEDEDEIYTDYTSNEEDEAEEEEEESE